MTVQTRPLAEISRRGFEILSWELGVVDAIRFINQFSTGHGDYTAEREAWLGSLTLDQILAELKATHPEESP